MGILTAIGSFLGSMFSPAKAAVSTAQSISNIVEKWAPSEEKKHEMQMDVEKAMQASIADARAMPLGNTATWFDSFANGINRLIRPLITIGLFGGLYGWWKLPAPGSVDPLVLNWIETVLCFWFGGRVLLKDLPSAIAYIKAVRGT